MESNQNYWEGWMRRRMSRRTMLRRAGLAGLAFAGTSSLWACGQTQTPKAEQATPAPSKEVRPKRGGTLKIGGTSQPDLLDPQRYINTNNDIFLRGIYDYVVNHDDKLNYAPEVSLAEAWELKDDVTIVFKLRKGVKFSDGTEWNAQVMKWNFERIANPELKSPRGYVMDTIKTIEYPDTYTAKVVLKEPMASFFGELAMAGVGMMSPNHVAKYSQKDLERNAVGTGPYIMTEIVTDDHHTMVRNKDYWRKDTNGEAMPYLDGLRFQIIPDATVRLANLRTGVIDMDIATDPKDVAKIKDDPNLKVSIQDGIFTYSVYWNMSRPPVTNLNFRRACSYAINREAIVKIATFGLSKPWTGLVQPAHTWAFDSKRPVAPYDPVKAKQYLDRAIAEGVKPEFKLFGPSTGITKQVAEMIQADLAEVGIKMSIVPDTNGTYRYWISFDNDTLYSGYSLTPDPYSKAYVAHYSTGAYVPEKRQIGKDWDTPEGYYAKFDPLLLAANTTYDPKKRAEFLNKASDVMQDHASFLGIYYNAKPTAMNKKVEGPIWGGDGHWRFAGTWLNT